MTCPDFYTEDGEFDGGDCVEGMSGCYSAEGVMIEDCECHEACRTCGYGDNPVELEDCLDCDYWDYEDATGITSCWFPDEDYTTEDEYGLWYLVFMIDYACDDVNDDDSDGMEDDYSDYLDYLCDSPVWIDLLEPTANGCEELEGNTVMVAHAAGNCEVMALNGFCDMTMEEVSDLQDYFEPDRSEYMLNYVGYDLESTVADLCHCSCTLEVYHACTNASDCAEDAFCSIQCFQGICEAVENVCQPCEECEYDSDSVSENCAEVCVAEPGHDNDEDGSVAFTGFMVAAVVIAGF